MVLSERSKFSNWLNDKLKDEFNTDSFHARAWKTARLAAKYGLRYKLGKELTISGKYAFYSTKNIPI